MRPGLLRQHGARDEDRRRGEEQLRLRRHQRHAGLQARLTPRRRGRCTAAPRCAITVGPLRRLARRGGRCRARGAGRAAGAWLLALAARRAALARGWRRLAGARRASRWRLSLWRQPAGPACAGTASAGRRHGRWRRRRSVPGRIEVAHRPAARGCCCASCPAARSAPRWPCAGSRSARWPGARWHALRCAVYSRADRVAPAVRRGEPRRSPRSDDRPPTPTPPLVERVKRATSKAFEMLVVKYQRRIERLIGRMVRDVDLVPGHRAGDLHPRLPGDAAVPRRERVLHLAVPDRRQHRQEGAGRPEARPAGDRNPPCAAGDDDDETSRVENELSDGETPDAVLASKEIAAAVNSAIEALVRRSAAGDHAARDRRPELRRDRRGDELPDRHGAVADLPGARGDCGAAAAAARHARGRALVSAADA